MILRRYITKTQTTISQQIDIAKGCHLVHPNPRVATHLVAYSTKWFDKNQMCITTNTGYIGSPILQQRTKLPSGGGRGAAGLKPKDKAKSLIIATCCLLLLKEKTLTAGSLCGYSALVWFASTAATGTIAANNSGASHASRSVRKAPSTTLSVNSNGFAAIFVLWWCNSPGHPPWAC